MSEKSVPVWSTRESIMKSWDKWRAYIANGGNASWPRDEFEALLDMFDERLSAAPPEPATNDAEEPAEVLAGRLINVWVADKGKKIPWAKAIQIVAIVTKQPDAERDRLLRMGDEDGSCEMCGRNALALNEENERLKVMYGCARVLCLVQGCSSKSFDEAIDAALASQKKEG